MIADTRVVKWKGDMRNSMFKNFNKYREIADVALVCRIINDKLMHVTLDISEVPRQLLRNRMYEVIESANPDAYIVIMNHKMALRPLSEAKQMEEDYKKAGSIDKMKDGKDIVVFTYETKLVSNVEMYEIINVDDDAVLNNDPIMDAMDIRQDIFLTGLLHAERHTRLIEIMELYDNKNEGD